MPNICSNNIISLEINVFKQFIFMVNYEAALSISKQIPPKTTSF